MTFQRILGDRLLLSPLPVKERSAGGIHLPQAHVGDVMQWWRVEQVGEGKRTKSRRIPSDNEHGYFIVGGGIEPLDFQVGDVVLTQLQFEHVTLEENGWKMVKVENIIAKFVNDPQPELN